MTIVYLTLTHKTTLVALATTLCSTCELVRATCQATQEYI